MTDFALIYSFKFIYKLKPVVIHTIHNIRIMTVKHLMSCVKINVDTDDKISKLEICPFLNYGEGAGVENR